MCTTTMSSNEVEAIIEAAYQRAATFDESDCCCSNAVDRSDVEKCLAEVYHAHAASRSSREATPPSSSKDDFRHSSSYPPGSDGVHVDWSEHYDRRESLDEIVIIDVDRFASRRSIQRSNENTTTIGAADRAYLDVGYYRRKLSSSSALATVDRPVNSDDRANNTTDYNEHSSYHHPIIYVSKHSLPSISTLGTEGFKSSATKTVDPFATSTQEQEGEDQPTDQHSRVLEGHAIGNERSAKKPPTPPRPLKRQTSTPPERNQRLSSSSVKHPGEGRPTVVTHDRQPEELSSWQDRTAFERHLKALKHAPPSKPPSTRRASAPIEWQQRSSSTRTKLSPISQSPYVVRELRLAVLIVVHQDRRHYHHHHRHLHGR